MIGPQHHLFLTYLQRRKAWISCLVQAYQNFASVGNRLPDAFAEEFSAPQKVAIYSPSDIRDLLDDRPVEVFLYQYSEDIDALEARAIQAILDHAPKNTAPGYASWSQNLEATADLWGRELAQECLITPVVGSPVHGSNSANGIYAAFHQTLRGGDFLWRSLLPRRCLEHELEYELSHCPHSYLKKDQAELACRLESRVFESFARTFLPSFRLDRERFSQYCLDRATI